MAAKNQRKILVTTNLVANDGIDMVATPGMPIKREFEDWKVGARYEIIKVVGRGATGEVARAKQF